MRRQIKGELLDGLRDELKKEPSENGWVSYQCTLVTPMYGGGVEAGKVDKDMPIRASAIRGQLRFWWRIACGPFNSPNEMFDRETNIWGGIGDKAKASRVEIRVDCKPIDANKLIASDKISTGMKKNWGVNYVLGASDPVNCLDSGYEFKIYIRYSSYPSSTLSEEVLEENVTKALRWWATFGGIGAKTRRGFGAIEVQGVERIPSTDFSDNKSNRHCLLALNTETFFNAKDAWQIATLRLQQFRHGKELGRNTGKTITDKRGNKIVLPGRSRWPEPDQLRRFTGDWKLKHDPEHKAGNAFPRAAFGMPILFDFNDGTNAEPQTMSLHPEGSERLSSPLILRPYHDGKTWRAAALLLPNWQEALAQPLELRRSSDNIKLGYRPNYWPTSPQERHELAQEIKPMQGRADDPLSAFLEYFKEGNS